MTMLDLDRMNIHNSSEVTVDIIRAGQSKRIICDEIVIILFIKDALLNINIIIAR